MLGVSVAELGLVGIVAPDRFAGLTALADRRQIFGTHRDHRTRDRLA